MIMVGAGTGLAPFRGFLLDRAAVADRGAAVGPSLLFFGCRDPEHRHDEVWDLLERRATIFVCGNANTMAPGVRAALADIHRQHTGSTSAQAQDWLADLRAQDRFLEDIWGG
jgi:cytochrome P450/NADPH-cytochrome P450 reductase